MAMRKCRECGKQVSTSAKACPFCGKPNPTQGAERVLAGVILFVMIFGCCIWYGNSANKSSSSSSPSGSSGGFPSPSASSPEPKAEPKHDKVMAWVMAQDFVKKQLKAPGSADFGGVFSGDWQNPESCVTDLGNGKFRCVGWVDAQNSFGAKLRNDFVVEVEYVGADRWRCNDITLTPR